MRKKQEQLGDKYWKLYWLINVIAYLLMIKKTNKLCGQE